MPRTTICIGFALAAGSVAAGCGGGSATAGSTHPVAHRSPRQIVACLARHRVASEVDRPDQTQPPAGDVELVDVLGEVGGHVGGALVTIDLISGGDVLVSYEGARPPRRLVLAVRDCA